MTSYKRKREVKQAHKGKCKREKLYKSFVLHVSLILFILLLINSYFFKVANIEFFFTIQRGKREIFNFLRAKEAAKEESTRFWGISYSNLTLENYFQDT
jgi:hypothetical protein